jgi:lipopolysaccharide heptosyltransferase II
MNASARGWSSARRILCVRLDTLGDVLMSTPAIRALGEGRPKRRITLLTSRSGAESARLVPEIDDVLVFDAPWMKSGRSVGADAFLETAHALARRGHDAAVIFTVYTQSPLPAALLCHVAGIPLVLAHCRENPYTLLSDWIPEPEPQSLVRHEVRRQLDLVASVGCRTADERLSLSIPESARRRVRRLLDERGVREGTPWLVLHPGASAESRRYPPSGFAEAARRLSTEAGVRVVFTGTEDERGLVDGIRSSMRGPSESLVGMLDPAELAALLSFAPLLISNNTGPVHVAAAVGAPVVVLYALTNPQHTPWGVPSRVLSHDVPCKFCYRSVCPEGHHNCLRLVDPDQVFRAAMELLDVSHRLPPRRPVTAAAPREPVPLVPSSASSPGDRRAGTRDRSPRPSAASP